MFRVFVLAWHITLAENQFDIGINLNAQQKSQFLMHHFLSDKDSVV